MIEQEEAAEGLEESLAATIDHEAAVNGMARFVAELCMARGADCLEMLDDVYDKAGEIIESELDQVWIH